MLRLTACSTGSLKTKALGRQFVCTLGVPIRTVRIGVLAPLAVVFGNAFVLAFFPHRGVNKPICAGSAIPVP